MVLLGVQLAQALIVLTALAALMVCLLVLIQRAKQAEAGRRLLPVVARQLARRANRRQVAFDPTPLPSRDPPFVSIPLESGSARADFLDVR